MVHLDRAGHAAAGSWNVTAILTVFCDKTACRYAAALSPGRWRVYLALDYYSDAAVALFVLASTAVQCLVGTPGGTILAAVALMLPVGVLTYFANRICKLLWPKQRRNLLYDELVSGWVRGSFPSFHSQFGATLGTTFSTAVVLLGPAQGKLQAGALAVLTMALPLALVAWSRLYLGVHDIVDIFGGVLIGASLGATWAGIAIALAWVPAGAFAWTQVAGLAVFVFGLGSWERHRRHSPSVGQWGIRLASRAQWRITDR